MTTSIRERFNLETTTSTAAACALSFALVALAVDTTLDYSAENFVQLQAQGASHSPSFVLASADSVALQQQRYNVAMLFFQNSAHQTFPEVRLQSGQSMSLAQQEGFIADACQAAIRAIEFEPTQTKHWHEDFWNILTSDERIAQATQEYQQWGASFQDEFCEDFSDPTQPTLAQS